MKLTGKCPKCNSENIFRFNGYKGFQGENYLSTGYSRFSAVDVNRYVCCDCGYTEEWIDKEDLTKVQESEHAIPQKKSRRKTV